MTRQGSQQVLRGATVLLLVSAVGPAAAVDVRSVDQGARVIHQVGDRLVVEAGHVALATDATAVVVEVPDGRVEISAESLVERGVKAGTTIRVASLRGGASFTPSGAAPLKVQGGMVFTGGAVRRLRNRERQMVQDRLRVAKPDVADATAPGATGTMMVEVSPAAETEADARAALANVRRLLGEEAPSDAVVEALEAYADYYPKGSMPIEGLALYVETLVEAKNETDALRALDRAKLPATDQGRRLRLERGRLRARSRRCVDAVADYDALVAGASDVANDAMFFRALCLTRLGQRARAQADLARYLARAPNGPHAQRARRRLVPTGPRHAAPSAP